MHLLWKPFAIALFSASRFLFPFQASCAVGSPSADPEWTAPTSGWIAVHRRSFIDQSGRQVIFHGVNVGSKSKRTGYQGPERPEDYRRLRAWGFNCIRLMIFWDGIEPKPGEFDEAYLDSVAERVRRAKESGLYVLLDMHQDLYSVRFADGAPEWATITDGQPHLTDAGIWSDAYFRSPAVQRALDHFWANSPAPDGRGLQDHYAEVWRVVASRFANEPAVLGYDLMNEPFPGSPASEAQQRMFAGGAEVLAGAATGLPTDPASLAELWLTPDGRSAILSALCNPDLYARIVDLSEPIYSRFERDVLSPFYRKLAEAIRSVDHRHLLFLETSMASNMGVRSAIEPITSPGGKRDPGQVYAPHGYDLVTDTRDVARPCSARVEFIFARHAETADRLQLPMFVGEWGAYGRTPGTSEAAWQVVHIFERLLCSETYWKYEPGVENSDAFRALWRPYPERVPGELLSYRCDPRRKTFQVRWREIAKIGEPALIYVPTWMELDKATVCVSPETRFEIVRTADSGHGSWLVISRAETGAQRELTIRPSNESTEEGP